MILPSQNFSDDEVSRFHPTTEMLARIRDILVDGLQLTVENVGIKQYHLVSSLTYSHSPRLWCLTDCGLFTRITN